MNSNTSKIANLKKELKANINLNLFKRHIKQIDQDSNILLISSTGTEENLVKIADEYIDGLEYQILIADSSKPIEIEGNYNLIIICDFDKASARNTHFKMQKSKLIGTPIVFGLCRALYFKSPEWKDVSVGINYSGMFKLASFYLNSVKGGKGDYMEFGVFDGRTVTLAYHALSKNVNRFFALDSYEGLIGTTSEENTNFIDGQFSSSIATFNHNMKTAGVNPNKVITIQSNFLTDLNDDLKVENKITRCSCAHIDVDIYAPAKAALNFLTDILVDGALILFDDYDHFGGSNEKGERLAVKEWLEENPNISLEEYRRYSVFCRSFIFSRKR